MSITTSIRGGVLVAALFLGAGLAVTAEAATCTTSGKGKSGATFGLTGTSGAECYSGNDSNQIDAGFTLFGKTGWTLSDKNEAQDRAGAVRFALAPINDHKFGTWAIKGKGAQHVAITLKAGNGFGAFLLDKTTWAGLWSSSKDLSHASIYTNGEPSPAPIPLPAAAWMLLAGLGGLGAVARRRKA